MFREKYDSIAELRREVQEFLGHDFPLTAAELPGKFEPNPMCDISCSSCERFNGCMEQGVAFMECGCSHFVHRGFEEERMATFNGIHLFLRGGRISTIIEFGYDREFSSLENVYNEFGHIPKPTYSVREKADCLEIVLWGRQVVGYVHL